MRWPAAAPRSVCGARGTPAGGWRASTKGKAPAGGSGLFQTGKPLAGGRGAIPFRRLNRRRHIRFHQWTRPGSSPIVSRDLPVGRPFDEVLLFEIASAYEAGTKHRRPSNEFGPLAGEP
jgi:hypothetical protein